MARRQDQTGGATREERREQIAPQLEVVSDDGQAEEERADLDPDE